MTEPDLSGDPTAAMGDDEALDADPPDRLTDDEEVDLVEADATAVSVSYSGQDFDVAGLVRRMKSEDILIPVFGHDDERISSAGFQRSFVWNRNQMDRFIESLLLGYPVPGIFLVRQEDRRYLVLDGQQRLRTLEHFMDGLHEGREFVLKNVATRFRGLTYKSLPEDTRRLLDDTFFQATIVATDETAESLDAIYQIFERVNAGGTQLTPHEIRVALYAGPMIDFIERLNVEKAWRALYGKKSPRLRDQELVLRIVALVVDGALYKRPLKSFLNNFVGSHRQLQGIDHGELEDRFRRTTNLINDGAGPSALRPAGPQLNAALTEAICVGLMRRLQTGPAITPAEVKGILAELDRDTDLQVATSRATADEETVRRRLEIATAAFAA